MSCESATSKITAIYQQPEIDDCICKLVKKELRPDFKQELFLILLQVPCDTIDRMNGDLKYYVVRVILNLVRQQKNVFHKTYLDKTIEYNTEKINYQVSSPAETDTISERIEKELSEEKIIVRLDTIDLELGNSSYPFHRELIKLINKYGTIREVEKITGIPRTTIHRTVKKVRDQLRK